MHRPPCPISFPLKPVAAPGRADASADAGRRRRAVGTCSGPAKPLRLAFESRKLHSFILWGPPGVGKTTLGRLAASVSNSQFIAISAVLAGIKDIRARRSTTPRTCSIGEGRSTVIFVDEIHSIQQDAAGRVLPHVESGLLTLVGGTTEHPGMEVNNALLSRAQVYNAAAARRRTISSDLYGQRARQHLPAVTLEPDALALLGGLRRRRRAALPQPAGAGDQRQGGRGAWPSTSTRRFADLGHQPVGLRRADKSRRLSYYRADRRRSTSRCSGSQPDAALYWLARMLDGGVDPRQVTRRMIAIASEDIGNADPRALQLAMNAAEAVDRLGPAGLRARARRTATHHVPGIGAEIERVLPGLEAGQGLRRARRHAGRADPFAQRAVPS